MFEDLKIWGAECEECVEDLRPRGAAFEECLKDLRLWVRILGHVQDLKIGELIWRRVSRI